MEELILRQVGVSSVAYRLILVYRGTRQLPIIHYAADEAAVRHLADTLSRYLERPLTQASAVGGVDHLKRTGSYNQQRRLLRRMTVIRTN